MMTRGTGEEKLQLLRGSELLMSQSFFMKHRQEFKPAFMILLYLHYNKLTAFDLVELGEELGITRHRMNCHYRELIKKGLIRQESKIKTFVEIRIMAKF